jgi:hypothetical protein
MTMERKDRASSGGGDESRGGPAWPSPIGQLVNGVLGRLPAQIPEQVEKRLRQGQEALGTAVAAMQSQLNKKASQADIDKLTERVDELTRQVQDLMKQRKAAAGGGTAGASSSARSTSSSSRAGSTTAARTTRRPSASSKDQRTGDKSKS